MRSLLALILLIVVIKATVDPESVGGWLKKVDDARYITTDYR